MALPGFALLAHVEGASGDQVQPAGMDLSVAAIEVFEEPGYLGTGERRIPAAKPLEPSNGVWRLGPGAYRVVFAETVRVPANAVGLCLPRSSLLRMGASLHCAVWDPGYHGRGRALLVVHNPYGVEIEVGARIAQLVLIRVEPPPPRLYSGRYQGER